MTRKREVSEKKQKSESFWRSYGMVQQLETDSPRVRKDLEKVWSNTGTYMMDYQMIAL